MHDHHQQQPPAPETEEIATTRDGRDITRGYIDHNHYLYPQDKVLRHRGANSYELYEDLLQDGRIFSTLAQRRLAVVSRPPKIVAGGDKRLDRKAADFLEEVIQHVRWRTVCDRMLYGVFYGYSVAELLWAHDGPHVFPDAIKVRNRRRFVFDIDFNPRLLTHESPQGELLPERKFWVLSTGADNDDEPYGRGLAHWLFWPLWFKKHQTKFWLGALEKFGSPTVIGRYRRNSTDEEKKNLLRAVEDVRTRTGITMPEDMIIELLEATRSGSMDYAGFRDAMNDEITMTVLTQTMTTEDGSSQSQAQVHKDVRDEVVEADAHLITESFNRGPATWLAQWNFPGAATPRVEIVMPNEARLAAIAERDTNITSMGYRLSQKYVENTYDVEIDGRAGPPPTSSPPGVSLAESGGQDPLIAALDAMDAEDWEAIASPVVRPILNRAKSDPEGLMADIAELYPELDASAIEAQLTRILFVSDTWERLAAQRGDA